MTRGTATIVALIVLFFVVLPLAIWGGTVWFSKYKGQGDAYSNKNSAENWTKAQEDFHSRYNNIIAADKNINVAWKALQADPTDQVSKINYNGLVNGCNEAIANYDTKAAAYNSADFRDASLPAKIDTTDPQTDCKED